MDNQETHTPGPWHLGGNGFIVYAANGYAICDVKTFHGRSNADAANAMLIAAAPELLAALKEMGDWLAAGLHASDDAWPDAKCLEHTEQIAARARAAVDKAENSR